MATGAPVAGIGVPGEARLAGVIEQPSCVPGATLASKGLSGRNGVPGTRRSRACWGREWSHPLFSAAETKGGSTLLAMTVWYVEIYLLGNWFSASLDLPQQANSGLVGNTGFHPSNGKSDRRWRPRLRRVFPQPADAPRKNRLQAK